MKTRESKLENWRWSARSVLECGTGLLRSKTWRRFAGCLAFCSLALTAGDQTYSIDSYEIAGGGGMNYLSLELPQIVLN